jgi:hypothetical protein
MYYQAFFSYLRFTESKFACVESRLSKATHKSFLHFSYNIIINKLDLTMKYKIRNISCFSVYFLFLSKVLILLLVFMQIERGKLDKGGYSSISGPRMIEKTFSDMSISGSGFGSGSGLGGLNTDMDLFASKPKGDRNIFHFFINILFENDGHTRKCFNISFFS